VLADALGERLGRAPDDVAVRTLAGAIVGVGLSAVLASEDRPAEFFEQLDAAFAQLEAGFEI